MGHVFHRRGTVLDATVSAPSLPTATKRHLGEPLDGCSICTKVIPATSESVESVYGKLKITSWA